MSTAVRTPIPLNRRLLAVAAVTTTLAAGLVTVVSLDGTDRVNDVPPRAELPSALTPEARRYVEWIVSATPKQLAATFGTGPVAAPRPIKVGVKTR